MGVKGQKRKHPNKTHHWDTPVAVGQQLGLQCTNCAQIWPANKLKPNNPCKP